MTSSKHIRWCITNVPITDAECSIFWYLYGWHPHKNIVRTFNFTRDRDA